MNVSQPAFQPVANATVNLSIAGTSAYTQFQTAQSARHCRVYNNTGAIAFIEFGPSGVVASTTTSMPVPVGVSIFAAPHPYVAAIGAGSGDIYFTPGEGSIV